MVKFLPSLKTQTTSNTLDHSSFPVATHLPFKFPHVYGRLTMPKV